MAIFGGGYFLCATFSGFFSHWATVSYVWLPSGWYLGGLLVTRPRQWPLMIVAAGLGDLGYNFASDPWPLSDLLQAHLGNTVSALAGAWLVRTFITRRPTLTSVRELAGLIGLGAGLSLIPTALNGAWLINQIEPGRTQYWASFMSWYASDLLGVILLTPVVIAWQNPVKVRSLWSVRRIILEYLALLLALCAVTSAAFYFHWLRRTETLYVAAPFIIWASLRFSLRGAATTILFTAMLAQLFTAMGYGSLGASSLSGAQKSLEMMVSLGVFAGVGLLPATVLAALKTAQARDAMRTHTMTLLAMGAKLPAILDSIVQGVEVEHPDGLCSILLMDQTGTRLLIGAAPNLPADYNQAVHGVTIGANVGSCGTAAFLNQRVIVEDIRTDPRWENYRELAVQAGLTSCWSQPFHDATGRVLGTFAIYHRQPERPTASDIRLITAASQMAAIATERKQLEAQFLRAQRMESIGTLASGIAHDFNNLLTPIIISVDMLKQGESNPDNRELLADIDLCAHRGASLVRQVLTFARGVDGSRDVLDIGLSVNEVADIVANTFSKGITLHQDIPRNLPQVMGDRTQIGQVLLNLCVNARDAMPKGGRLSIRACERQLDERSATLHQDALPGRYVEIEVSDTGCGMSPELMQRIFEPFYTSKEVGRGTGLGLSTALGIMRNHAGFITVESKVDAGSTFRLYLPALAAGFLSTEAPETPPTLARGDSELILLVDDEPVLRRTTSLALTGFGYRVIVAEDGVEALRQMKEHETDIAVVITDMMMPVMDGSGLIAELHKLHPDIPIITVSGLKTDETAAITGWHHHLTKPYTTEGLFSVLARVLGKGPKTAGRAGPLSDGG